jgi:hypothetical protein
MHGPLSAPTSKSACFGGVSQDLPIFKFVLYLRTELGRGSFTDQFSALSSVVQKPGLRLESAKGPGEFLVIDSVEKPSEN